MNLLRNIPKDKQQKIILVGIVTLVAVVGAVQFYVLNRWRSYATARQEIEQLHTQIADVQHRQQATTEHQELTKQLQQFVDVQQAAMAQGDAFAWAVREVSLLIEKHSIHVLSLRPGSGGNKPTTGSKEPITYTTRLEVTGTYDQLGSFIKDIENRFPTAEIRALEMAGEAGGPGTHQVNIDLAFRVRPDPPKAKTARKVTS